MYKTFLPLESSYHEVTHQFQLLLLYKHLCRDLLNRVGKQSNGDSQKTIKNELDTGESAREETKIQKKPSRNTRKIIIITLTFATLSVAILFAGSQSAIVTPRPKVELTPSPTGPVTPALPAVAANDQDSSLSGLPVLGVILGLASIAAYVMERLLSSPTHH